jgi:putative ABC transport system ATP-binding protein
MIRLENVTKIYGSGEAAVTALAGVDLTVPDGCFLSVTGESGGGKSTLLNLIGGLDKATSGLVEADGKDLSALSDRELSQYRNKRVGFVFQSYFLEPAFTVLENAAVPLTLAGVPKKMREETAAELLRLVRLEHKMYKRANELSGGEKQRAAIARALANEPAILLADEPTGNLDAANAEDVMRILAAVHRAGRTVVLVTHNAEYARTAQVQIRIKNGSIVEKAA